MTETITRCDGCGKVKGQANKWIDTWVRYWVRDRDKVPIFIAIGPTSGDLSTDPDYYEHEDYCSETCLHKRLNEVLAAIREEKPAGERGSNEV